MHTIKQTAIERIARQLNNLRVDFVIDPGDEAELITAPNSQLSAARRPLRDGKRALYVGEYLNGLQPGESVFIPFGSYTKTELSGSIGSRAHALFGRGNYVTEADDARGGYHVLCLDLPLSEEEGHV
jgi:hypothetical protein